MKNFKLELAAFLSLITAAVITMSMADGFIAIGGNLGLLCEIVFGAITTAIAMPVALIMITAWQKTSKKSYCQFKKWCKFQISELTRA